MVDEMAVRLSVCVDLCRCMNGIGSNPLKPSLLFYIECIYLLSNYKGFIFYYFILFVNIIFLSFLFVFGCVVFFKKRCNFIRNECKSKISKPVKGTVSVRITIYHQWVWFVIYNY